MLSITLDWLAFTFREDTHEQHRWMDTYASNQGAMEIAPTNGYKSAYRTVQGVVCMWNLDRPEMGYHVIISGSAIRHVLSDYQLEQKALVETVLHAGGSLTRLDLAKDSEGKYISLDKIYKAMECGERSGTARTFSQMHGSDGGNTIYVGSRTSEKFVRVYDKGAQQGDISTNWFRMEIETKGMVARALATLLCESDNWSGGFDAMLRAMVDVPSSTDWKQFFLPGVVPIGIPKLEKKSDREAWIEAQVTPAVAKHYVEFPKSAAVARLRALLDILAKQGD